MPKKRKKDPVPELAADLALAGFEAGIWKDFDSAEDLGGYCLAVAAAILEPEEDEEGDEEED